MNVRLFGYIRGAGYGNIMWASHPHDSHPMRGGKFPPTHPCATNPKPTVNHGEAPQSDDGLGKFRALGYWASCFPEGDGICFEPPEGKERDQVPRDIEACFGWKVRVVRL